MYVTCINFSIFLLSMYVYTHIYTYIQGIHKRMVRFQKLTRNLFLTLHGHNVQRQQRQLSKFLMRYQQFASDAYCGAPGPVSKMASQQEKAFCVLRFEMSISVITGQREFRAARFRKDAPPWVSCTVYKRRTIHGASFISRAWNSRCTVITDLDTSKRSTQKAFTYCDAILETGPAVSMKSELLVAHEKLGQLPLLMVYVVPVLGKKYISCFLTILLPYF